MEPLYQHRELEDLHGYADQAIIITVMKAVTRDGLNHQLSSQFRFNGLLINPQYQPAPQKPQYQPQYPQQQQPQYQPQSQYQQPPQQAAPPPPPQQILSKP